MFPNLVLEKKLSINQDIFLAINAFANQSNALDSAMILIAESMPYMFIGLLLYLWFSKRRNEALYTGYAATLGVVMNLVIGVFYFHPRPFMDHLGVTLVKHQAENSFPSDHTTFVLSIALALLGFKSTRTLGSIAMLFALWCGIARIYCGVHYPFDIVGSLVVSVLVVTTILALQTKLIVLNHFIITLWEKIFARDN
jgi:undecaprenyl-diphosphatase